MMVSPKELTVLLVVVGCAAALRISPRHMRKIESSDQINSDHIVRVGAGDSEPPPNIGYVGMGYNLVKGNPRGSPQGGQADPGFTQPVLKLEIKDNCPDWEYLCPTQGYARKKNSCNFQSSSTEISTMSSYQSELKVEAKFTVGDTESPAFSASAGYQESEKKVKNENINIFESKAQCVVMVAGMKSTVDLTKWIDPDYKAAADALPTAAPSINDTSTDTRDKWYAHFDAYGTHFAREVELGAKLVHRTYAKRNEVEKLQAMGVDVSAAFSVSFGNETKNKTAEFDVSGGVGYKQSQFDKASRAIAKQEDINVGGYPDDVWQEWAATAEQRPMPVAYQLESLATLEKDPQKRANMEVAINMYMLSLGSIDDSPPPNADDAIASGILKALIRPEGDAVYQKGVQAVKASKGVYKVTYLKSATDTKEFGEFVPIVSPVYSNLQRFGSADKVTVNSLLTGIDKVRSTVLTGSSGGNLYNKYWGGLFVDPALNAHEGIVAGVVHDDTSILSGMKGITAVRNAKGVFTVTFKNPFASPPAVVVNHVVDDTSPSDTRDRCTLLGTAADKFAVACGKSDSGNYQDFKFTFLAVGEPNAEVQSNVHDHSDGGEDGAPAKAVKLEDNGILYGVVSKGGNVKRGTRYTVSKGSTEGHYTIMFDQKYKAPPVVLVEAQWNSAAFSSRPDLTWRNCVLTGVSYEKFSIQCGYYEGVWSNDLEDSWFSFIVVGS